MSLCVICHEIENTNISHERKALFHQECLKKWVTILLGEIISLNRIQCPHCKHLLDLSQFSQPTEGKIFTLAEIEALDFLKPKMYRKTCLKVFACGGRECETNLAQMLELRIKCPKCSIELEHAGGCNAFACCLKGWHGCTGAQCDHGSTEFTKFCGHRWCIEDSLAMSGEDSEEFRNPLGDNPSYEHCLNEVQRDGSMLHYVPETLKTPELCLIAVQQNH